MTFNKVHYLLLTSSILFIGCGEGEYVSPSVEYCKDFNIEYLSKLSKDNNIDSARKLSTFYVECNLDDDKQYKELALQWSEKVMSFKEANNDDLKLYRALRNLDIDTGKSEGL